ncbi:MAG: helix-turn-helix transcriptional regulator [Austwickia sp.]|nr:MAG: helix-turn-helix transcriptional regulator [Austwickia sp.]
MRKRPRTEVAEPPGSAEAADHGIEVRLDEVLAARGMTLTQLSQQTGTTLANLSILKNGRARAVRFTSLTAICRALECEPGNILKLSPAEGPDQPHNPPVGGR